MKTLKQAAQEAEDLCIKLALEEARKPTTRIGLIKPLRYIQDGTRRVGTKKTRIGYACDPRAKRLHHSFMNEKGGTL